MATKLKTLKQPEIEKLIKQIEHEYDVLSRTEVTDIVSLQVNLGYALSSFNYLIKQLKGEWPIL